MSKFTIMGENPGDGGVYEATDFFNAFVKYVISETCEPDVSDAEKKRTTESHLL